MDTDKIRVYVPRFERCGTFVKLFVDDIVCKVFVQYIPKYGCLFIVFSTAAPIASLLLFFTSIFNNGYYDVIIFNNNNDGIIILIKIFVVIISTSSSSSFIIIFFIVFFKFEFYLV